jgi:hypothetical protein
VVVSELRKACLGEILVGGRDLDRGKAFAQSFDGHVSATRLDVLDAEGLDRFCGECSIIVHCGGPVMRLRVRVAQAARRHACHYVDLAGLSVVKESLLPHEQEIAGQGLRFVVSAGWLPGLTELLPAYAHARATERMDTVESMAVYFGDSGEWSPAAFRDMAWYLRRTGMQRAGYFAKGERVYVPMRQGSPRVDLGGRVGRRRFALQSLPEQDEIGRRLRECDVVFHAFLPNLGAALAATLAALLPLPNGLSARLLRRAFRRTSLPMGGFVVVRVTGRSQGRPMTQLTELVFGKGQEYQINGLAIATVARLIAEGRHFRPGVHFLSEAVDPVAFVDELRKSGLEVSEQVERE